MDVGTFCAQSHVIVVAGKGGVGKTTMSAALAKMAAGAGKSVLIVELEGKSGITAAFGRPGTWATKKSCWHPHCRVDRPDRRRHGASRPGGSRPTTRWWSISRTTA